MAVAATTWFGLGEGRRLEAERIYLRDVAEADATERYAAWMNDAEVTRYMETRFSTHSPEGLREYVRAMRASPNTLFLAIVLRRDNRHIGNIKVGPVDPVHHSADVALMIGDKACWGRGFAAEAIGAVSDHSFAHLGVRKLTAGCYRSNVGSRRAFERAGYHVEAVKRSQYFCEGEFQDGLLLARFHPDAGVTLP
jgi:[ribosomal protein S5]-alanine N-acetyltransferase